MSSSEDDVPMKVDESSEDEVAVQNVNEDDDKQSDSSSSDYSSGEESEEEMEIDPAVREAERAANKKIFDVEMAKPLCMVFGKGELLTNRAVLLRSKIFASIIPDVETPGEVIRVNIGDDPIFTKELLAIHVKFLDICHQQGYYKDIPSRPNAIFIPPSVNLEDYKLPEEGVDIYYNLRVPSQVPGRTMLDKSMLKPLHEIAESLRWNICLDGIREAIAREVSKKTPDEIAQDNGFPKFTDEMKAEVIRRHPDLA